MSEQCIDLFVTQLQKSLNEIASDPRDYEEWRDRLESLWKAVQLLRTIQRRLTHSDDNSIIYHYIFIEEMLECLDKSVLPEENRHFVVVPSGNLCVWFINEAFADVCMDWFDEDICDQFEQLKHRSPIWCSECLVESNIEWQSVLAHEVFHIAVGNHTPLREFLDRMSLETWLQGVLGVSGDTRSQVEEAFCDFAAAWFYGPIYLQAFADEVSYYDINPSWSHPASDLRAKFLLLMNRKQKATKYYKALRHYLDVRKGTSNAGSTNKCLSRIGKLFQEQLSRNGLNAYQHIDKVDEVAKCFEHNIPFVTNDVRDLINNLPVCPSRDDRRRQGMLISESLRRINIIRQAKEHIRGGDALFALPKPLKPISQKRGKSR